MLDLKCLPDFCAYVWLSGAGLLRNKPKLPACAGLASNLLTITDITSRHSDTRVKPTVSGGWLKPSRWQLLPPLQSTKPGCL